jgi:hypothetical protein
MTSPFVESLTRSSRLNLLTASQLPSQRAWLSPADPSTNHNILRMAHNEGTAVWFFQGKIFIEWKSTGRILWIHGKRTFLSECLGRAPSDSDVASGLREKRPLVRLSFLASCWDLFFASSSIIQDITVLCKAGSAIMAYFYFDSTDLNKQTCHDLLRSLVYQLSIRSSPCGDILNHIYKTHENGDQQPSDETLKEYLKEMLRLPGQGPIFIILDALDECPESPGIPSPRHKVLQLVKELVDLHLQGRLHICVTSRPEVDIRAVLEPLASHSVSLHDESGQKTDIADYVRSVVNLSPSTAMRTWRVEDKSLVTDSLTERADGM